MPYSSTYPANPNVDANALLQRGLELKRQEEEQQKLLLKSLQDQQKSLQDQQKSLLEKQRKLVDDINSNHAVFAEVINHNADVLSNKADKAALATKADKAALDKMKSDLANTNAALANTDAELAKTNAELAKTNAELAKIKTDLDKIKTDLDKKADKATVDKLANDTKANLANKADKATVDKLASETEGNLNKKADKAALESFESKTNAKLAENSALDLKQAGILEELATNHQQIFVKVDNFITKDKQHEDEQEAEIDAVEQVNTTQNNQITQLQTELAEFKKDHVKQIAELRGQIAELRGQIDELLQLKSLIGSVAHSVHLFNNYGKQFVSKQ
jgi:hypothetical protein